MNRIIIEKAENGYVIKEIVQDVASAGMTYVAGSVSDLQHWIEANFDYNPKQRDKLDREEDY